MVYLGVVIRIDTDFFSAQMESIGTMFHGFQFMVGLKVRKSPQTAVDDVRKALFLRYLKIEEENYEKAGEKTL